MNMKENIILAILAIGVIAVLSFGVFVLYDTLHIPNPVTTPSAFEIACKEYFKDRDVTTNVLIITKMPNTPSTCAVIKLDEVMPASREVK